ncbi:uncharacterized protein LOC143218769 isoform X1 [Lasioglossum baleicum]|uniref:uncharacterized protein LOC143218769 isoform X1 n=2 Tax=Lasioglossum baleicum TaxID=434251 RepID=UPI003FCDCAB0
MMSSLCFILILSALMIEQPVAEEIWQQDLSKDMQIGASTGGFDQVNLRCGAEKMVVSLKTAEDFEGVIYTQGSFYSKKPPCFLDPARGGNFTINIPFNECHTENEDNRYKNILVMQHDDELITPGDAAFILECDFSKPRNIIVSAELKESDEREVRSSISLVDPDPGRDESKRAAYVESNSDRVFYMPNSIPKINDEL